MVIRTGQLTAIAVVHRKESETRLAAALANEPLAKFASGDARSEFAQRTVESAERFGIVADEPLLSFARLTLRFGEQFETYPAPEVAVSTLESKALDQTSKVSMLDRFARLLPKAKSAGTAR